MILVAGMASFSTAAYAHGEGEAATHCGEKASKHAETGHCSGEPAKDTTAGAHCTDRSAAEVKPAASTTGPAEKKAGTTSSSASSTGQASPAALPVAAAETSSKDPRIKTAKELAPQSIGQLQTCLVTTERFKVEAQTPAVMHDGKAHVFCCDGCAQEFLATPADFLPSK